MKTKEEIYNVILNLSMHEGLKSVTMDRVAAELGMSKRTLYELFGSKTELIHLAFDHYHKLHISRCDEIFNRAPNVMQGMLDVYSHVRFILQNTHVDFFRDMDETFAELRPRYEELENQKNKHFMEMYAKGVEEGVFRSDVNFMVQSKLLQVQSEAVKRMEELFPPDISPIDVFDSIIIGFLRSIASPRGMKMLDGMTDKINHQADSTID